MRLIGVLSVITECLWHGGQGEKLSSQWNPRELVGAPDYQLDNPSHRLSGTWFTCAVIFVPYHAFR